MVWSWKELDLEDDTIQGVCKMGVFQFLDNTGEMLSIFETRYDAISATLFS